MNYAYQIVGGPTLEELLLARHLMIDRLLERAIEAGEVEQVIEVAAGLSSRGCRFMEKYGDRIHYVEADLPDMTAHKRRILERVGINSERHRLAEIDALAGSGDASIGGVTRRMLDPTKGTALITEGLLPYFDFETVLGMWCRFSAALRAFPRGLYLSDLHLSGETGGVHGARAFPALLSVFTAFLSVFTGGRVHTHFEHVVDAERTLADSGFSDVTLHQAGDGSSELGIVDADRSSIVRIVEARTIGEGENAGIEPG